MVVRGTKMVSAIHQVRLSDIDSLVKHVPRYPISVNRLLELARQRRINRAVISFYKAFPESAVFVDKDDILSRSEAVDIMQREDQPLEDEVRGAED